MVAIEHGGTEPCRVELSCILINASHSFFENLVVFEEMTVMIKILDINFETPFSNTVEILLRHVIAFFWHNLKGSGYAELSVNSHQG